MRHIPYEPIYTNQNSFKYRMKKEFRIQLHDRFFISPGSQAWLKPEIGEGRIAALTTDPKTVEPSELTWIVEYGWTDNELLSPRPCFLLGALVFDTLYKIMSQWVGVRKFENWQRAANEYVEFSLESGQSKKAALASYDTIIAHWEEFRNKVVR